MAVALLLCCLAADGPAYLYRARGIDPSILRSDERVRVTESDDAWTFVPSDHPAPSPSSSSPAAWLIRPPTPPSHATSPSVDTGSWW